MLVVNDPTYYFNLIVINRLILIFRFQQLNRRTGRMGVSVFGVGTLANR